MADRDKRQDTLRNLDYPGSAAVRELGVRLRGVNCVLRPEDCPVLIGRDRSCGFAVSGDTASRIHGRIGWEEGLFYYADQSRNGSYVLTHAGDEQFLRPGERIWLVGEGAISPGAPVAEQTGEVVRYACSPSRRAAPKPDAQAARTRTRSRPR